MDEARQVLERLERIDDLRRRAAPPQALLAELRALLVEGEAWAAAEGAQAAGARRQLARLAAALDDRDPCPTADAAADRQAKEVVRGNALV